MYELARKHLANHVLCFGLVYVLTGMSGASALPLQFPDCNSEKVAKHIIRDFNWAEKYTWKSDDRLTRLEGMHEHRTVAIRNSEVTRRYCNATALMEDGGKHQIWYLIEDKGGFVGKRWGVTHCVYGHERWQNHNGGCRTLR